MTRFSLVTPVMNGMPWLPATIASIHAQRAEADVELFVQDAGSTDGSREWLRAHSAPDDVLVFEPDEGQTDALLRAFARATGDVLGWLNADDLLEPGALARVREAFAAAPDAVAVTGGCLLVGPDDAIVGAVPVVPDASLAGLLANPVNLAQPATFFRRDAFMRVGGLDRRLDYAMDVDLWMKLARAGRIVILRDVVLARFRVHPAAKSQRDRRLTAAEDLRVRRRHGLSLRSPAARVLLRQMYVEPVQVRVRRLFGRRR